jgi:hypothetical protein
VPKTRKINNFTLKDDIVLGAYDIPFENSSVGRKLELLGAMVKIIGSVPTIADLPD